MNSFPCNYDEHNKVWSTPTVEPMYNYKCSMGKILISTMRNYPNQIIQIDAVTQKTLTNSEAVTLATRIALHFKKLGLSHDDVIGICAGNSTYVMPTVLGCVFNSTPFHAVDPIYDEVTLSHCFGVTKPKIVFCDSDEYEKIRKSTEEFKPQIYTLTDRIEGVPHIEDLLEPSKMELFYQPERQILGANQTVGVLSSSGTTGMPKAVCLCSSAFLINNRFTNSESVLLSFTGINWYTALVYLFTTCLAGSTRVITNKRFSCEHFMEIVQKYKVTCVYLPPFHISALVGSSIATREALKSIRMVQCGGGPVPTKTLQRFKDLLHSQGVIAIGYAFTEILMVSANIGLCKANSVGKLWQSLKMRIVDNNGNNLGPNEVGEIFLYKHQHWNGYYGNPIETLNMRDAQGWYHSGDMGYMDDDNYLYLVGRKKEILKYQGLQYWPKEIEDVIAELPDVVETCVVGINDEINGDAAGALVVKNKNSHLTELEIIDYVAKRLVSQLNAGVYFVDAIPHNSNGKVSQLEAKPLFQSLKERNAAC